jgi:hypothetical protein
MQSNKKNQFIGNKNEQISFVSEILHQFVPTSRCSINEKSTNESSKVSNQYVMNQQFSDCRWESSTTIFVISVAHD